MARTSVYLNFKGETEAAFNFYKEVFGTEFLMDFQRMGSMPTSPDMPPIPEASMNLIIHVELPILGGLVLMGTDVFESMGDSLVMGNNVALNLEPDNRAETDALYAKLSAGGEATWPLSEAFWGGYYGTCTDKFGVRWMFNCASQE